MSSISLSSVKSSFRSCRSCRISPKLIMPSPLSSNFRNTSFTLSLGMPALAMATSPSRAGGNFMPGPAFQSSFSRQLPPLPVSPQTIMEPSSLRAANASNVDSIRTTPFASSPLTARLSPPDRLEPQVTTEPPRFTAAKAYWFANSFSTPLLSSSFGGYLMSSLCRLGSSCMFCPQQTTAPDAVKAAKDLSVEHILTTSCNSFTTSLPC
mmetsp:Transcript_92185/g.169072  ORF Transcript_92185/g.169072 Transcript_92185/m.169072 type:complete len:209 (-) Transcript_92185:470-1096(-)